tara:strand:+ start:62 stop:808 length:747 start_codon:yes stop_codon:yes gene_type:complete
MEFSSRENKSMLWDMLIDSGSFIGLNDINEVQNAFETSITQIDRVNPNTDILNKNKIFLGNFMKILVTLKTTNKPNYEPISNSNVSRESQQEERNNIFERRLRARQDEFTNLIDKPKPQNIDFTDNNKDINGNIDSMLEKMNNDRDRDLQFNISPEQQQEAQKWLSNDSNNPIQLKIDHDSTIQNTNEIVIGENKKVSFKIEESNNMAETFFKKLKNGPTEIDNILLELREIKDAQHKILSLLENKIN